MSEAGKDTIYIDVDDEITSIIDKVANAKHKIVALVLPKRASVLQSIVNMKLLKRSGDTHKKQLVLITSEAGLLPLAGAVKLHVAKTLQSKPAIPAGPNIPADDLAVDEDDDTGVDDIDDLEDDDVDEDPKVDKAKSVGELAGAAAVGAKLANNDDETIELDNAVDGDATSASPSATSKSGAKSKSAKGDKKPKVPNFNKFRKRTLLIGGAVVALIILWILGITVLPKATVIIKTDNVSVNTDLVFTASTSAEELNEEKSIVPAVSKDVKKTDSEKVPATGKKNVGEKATGTVTMKLTNCDQDSVTIPAGTGVSNGSLTFITQTGVTFNSVKIGNQCKNDSFPTFTSGTVKVTAQNPGDQYNISGGRTFTINGFSNVSGVDSSAMTGGTSKEITVVSAQDVESAKSKLTDKSKSAASSELEKQLEEEGLFPIPETLTSSPAAITATPAVDQEASEVTVTSTTTYSMLGVKRDDLKKLVVKSVEDDIDTSKQKVADDGLDKAVFKLGEKASPTDQKINVQTTVSTGAQIDEASLKKEIAGKKKGEVQQIIGAYPGVKEVEVKYSPFWVYKTPKNPSKITLVFEQAENANN